MFTYIITLRLNFYRNVKFFLILVYYKAANKIDLILRPRLIFRVYYKKINKIRLYALAKPGV